MSHIALSAKRKVLGVFSLAMITVGSVDSIRNLPATSLFGSTVLFFFIISAIFFLVPSALVSSELASTSNEYGGVYTWVKNAFGLQTGFFAIWFQWIENVVWYPTILSFVAGTIGYLIAPSLASSKIFLIAVIICSFWGATLVNLYGIKSSARFSNICSLAGLLLPMTLIIALGVTWLCLGKPLQIHFQAHDLFPHGYNSHMWVALTGIMLSFCGMEIAAVHDGDVKNPQRSFPRAMLLATFIILITLIFGSLSIAMVLPSQKISLVSGIMQAFDAFFSAYHMHWILPVLVVMLVVGGMGAVSNWIIAPTRGLLFAIKDSRLLPSLQKENRHGSPVALLIGQAIIVTFISSVFLLMPSVNGSYWLLTALTAQLYMMMYLLMFAAAIRLRYKKHNQRKGFRIPGGNAGMWFVASIGLIGSFVTWLIGFVPPENIQVGGTLHYETLLSIGLIVMSLPPFLLYWAYRKKQDPEEALLPSEPLNDMA